MNESPPQNAPHRPKVALLLDVDGTLSPIHGMTSWGDDLVAGNVFGDVIISPTMCRRLVGTCTSQGLAAYWLTFWTAEMRTMFNKHIGSSWPDLATEVPRDPVSAHPIGNPGISWWKWQIVANWLDTQPHIEAVIWCDDHLDSPPEQSETDEDLAYSLHEIVERELERRRIRCLLVSPASNVGLTQDDLKRIESFS